MMPDGVLVTPLEAHEDDRGTFTEIFRESWKVGVRPIQWNAVHSKPGVLRGVHVHVRHRDYWTMLSGRATLGLKDLRQGSQTRGQSETVEVYGTFPVAITIPPGVAHGFYFHAQSLHVYAVSEYWDTDDELGCHWLDPDLAIHWPTTHAMTSARDSAAGTLQELLEKLSPYQPMLF